MWHLLGLQDSALCFPPLLPASALLAATLFFDHWHWSSRAFGNQHLEAHRVGVASLQCQPLPPAASWGFT